MKVLSLLGELKQLFTLFSHLDQNSAVPSRCFFLGYQALLFHSLEDIGNGVPLLVDKAGQFRRSSHIAHSVNNEQHIRLNGQNALLVHFHIPELCYHMVYATQENPQIVFPIFSFSGFYIARVGQCITSLYSEL